MKDAGETIPICFFAERNAEVFLTQNWDRYCVHMELSLGAHSDFDEADCEVLALQRHAGPLFLIQFDDAQRHAAGIQCLD